MKKELNNLALQGKNVVCTDPKGELFGITREIFEKEGYDVKVFNLVNPEHPDGIDIFMFIEKKIESQLISQVVLITTKKS